MSGLRPRRAVVFPACNAEALYAMAAAAILFPWSAPRALAQESRSPTMARDSAPVGEPIAATFADFRRACQADGGRLWGVSLCGPVLVAEREAGLLYANRDAPGASLQPTPSGTYVTALPAEVPAANMAFEWQGSEWALVQAPLPEDPVDRAELLVHESFHRVQDDLGLAALEGSNAHLAGRDGRVWLRLEMRALARALTADSASGIEAVRDAFLFRARRQALDPGAAAGETALEIQEGLPSYTGAVLASASASDAERRAAVDLAAFEERDSFARSFAYATGPALGLLADRYAPGWREAIRSRRDLAGLLASAIGFEAPAAVAREAETRAEGYGVGEIAAEEDARRARAECRIADYRARLIEGPVLVLALAEMRFTMDPTAVMPLGEEGTVHPTITLHDLWGTLVVEAGGALISADFTRAAVPRADAPAECRPAGAGWSLELAPGWRLVPGDRPGDCRAAEAPVEGRQISE